MSATSLRVALLSPSYRPGAPCERESFARELADGLLAHGHQPTIVAGHRGMPRRTIEGGVEIVRNWHPPEGRLERRMFECHLSHIPFSYLSLMRGAFDVAHALHPTDAVAAGHWRTRTGRPAVLTYMGVPHRRTLASRRLRIEITQRAFAQCSAVVVRSEEAAASCERWLGVRPRVIAGDSREALVEDYVALYRGPEASL